MKYQFKDVEDIYTGGGIYLFVGSFTDGKGFLADGDMFDVRIFDTLPTDLNIVMDSVEWQEEHLFKDLDTEKEGPEFICSVIDFVRRKTKGRYDSLLDYIYTDAKGYIGKTNWR